MLDLGTDEENIFQHSKEFDQGGGNIRRGQGTYVVAMDGSGDFATIAEAYKALPAAGGCIYVKEGTYYQGAELTITKNNISIIGQGRGTILRHSDRSGVTTFFNCTAKGFLLKDLWIDGEGYPVWDGNQISAIKLYNGSEDCTITECWITGCLNGIRLREGVKSCKIINNFIFGTSSYGIEINVVLSGNYVKKCLIAGNHIYSCTSWGIYYVSPGSATNAIYNIFANNIVDSCANGILIGDKTTLTTVIGNQCINNTGTGLNLGAVIAWQPTRCLNSGNILYGNGTNYSNTGTNCQTGHNLTE